MSINLVRTTTYFDPTLLNLAKKRAIDESKSLYAIINEALQNLLNEKTTTVQEENLNTNNKSIFPTYKLGLIKKTIKRSDAYEL